MNLNVRIAISLYIITSYTFDNHNTCPTHVFLANIACEYLN